MFDVCHFFFAKNDRPGIFSPGLSNPYFTRHSLNSKEGIGKGNCSLLGQSDCSFPHWSVRVLLHLGSHLRETGKIQTVLCSFVCGQQRDSVGQAIQMLAEHWTNHISIERMVESMS